MRSGLSRSEAVETIHSVASQNGRKPSEPLAVIAADVQYGFRNGLGFGQALASWVPKEEHVVLAVIDDTNRFQEQLARFCDALERKAGQKRSAAAAMAYPAFLLLLAFGLLGYFDSRIVPALDRLLPSEQWRGAAQMLKAASGLAAEQAPLAAVLAVAAPLALALALPRWAGPGRAFADKLPLFAMYRVHTGAAFLDSVASLMANGMSAVQAISRVRASARPYVADRIDRIRFHLLNGCDLGTAMHMAGTGWPDPELNLSLKICARSSDFPALLARIAEEWVENAEEDAQRRIALFRTAAFIAVFGVILGVVFAMYEIQGQIAAGF